MITTCKNHNSSITQMSLSLHHHKATTMKTTWWRSIWKKLLRILKGHFRKINFNRLKKSPRWPRFSNHLDSNSLSLITLRARKGLMCLILQTSNHRFQLYWTSTNLEREGFRRYSGFILANTFPKDVSLKRCKNQWPRLIWVNSWNSAKTSKYLSIRLNSRRFSRSRAIRDTGLSRLSSLNKQLLVSVLRWTEWDSLRLTRN